MPSPPSASGPILQHDPAADEAPHAGLGAAATICGNAAARSSARSRPRQSTDLDLLYACIEPSLGSKEFFLRKAIGWALRQYAWTDPDEVRRYVAANEARLERAQPARGAQEYRGGTDSAKADMIRMGAAAPACHARPDKLAQGRGTAMAAECSSGRKSRRGTVHARIHRGEGMALLAMNWRGGQPPDDLSASRSNIRSRAAPGSSR